MGAGKYDHKQLAQEIDLYTSGIDVGPTAATSPFGMLREREKRAGGEEGERGRGERGRGGEGRARLTVCMQIYKLRVREFTYTRQACAETFPRCSIYSTWFWVTEMLLSQTQSFSTR